MPYTKKVIDHFRNPKNQGVIKNADSVGEKGNPVCGDVMKIYLKIKQQENKKTRKQENYVEDIKFETLGCAAAIAVSSILTEIAKGMELEKASKLAKDEIGKSLGGLPDAKIHCSMLGVEALYEAINKYKNN